MGLKCSPGGCEGPAVRSECVWAAGGAGPLCSSCRAGGGRARPLPAPGWGRGGSSCPESALGWAAGPRAAPLVTYSPTVSLLNGEVGGLWDGNALGRH